MPTQVDPHDDAEFTAESAERSAEVLKSSSAEGHAGTPALQHSSTPELADDEDEDGDVEEDDADEERESVPPTPLKRRHFRTPTVLQMEAVECGAASLGIILAYHGRYVPLEQLRVDCGVSRDGSSASNVMRAAENYMLESECWSMELYDIYQEESLPCILFWNFNHFLVLEGFGRGKVYLNDPAVGRRIVSDEEFDQGFSGIAITFTRGEKFTRGGRKPSVIGALRKRLPGVRTAVSYCVLAGLGLVIPGLAIPTFTKIFVDDILIGGSNRWLLPLLIGMAVAALLRGGLTALQQHHLMRASTKLAISSTGRFLWHVLRLPIDFFQQRYAGDIASRIGSNQRVASVLTGDLAVNIIGGFTALFYVAIMLHYDVLLTIIGVSLTLLNLAILRIVSRRQADESQKMLQESGKVMATAMGGIRNIESVKASARETDLFARWSGYQAKYSMADQRLSASMGFLEMVPGVLTLVSSAIVLGVGGFHVMNGVMTIGMLVAFQTLLVSFARPINDLVNLGGTIQRLAGDMKRLDDVANYPIDSIYAAVPEHVTSNGHVGSNGDRGRGPHSQLVANGVPSQSQPMAIGDPTREPRETAVVLRGRLNGYLELRNVTFGYSRLDEPLLKNFSLELAPGDRVALVGGSGSGKSTIAKLISGLYRPWSGEILFDGKPREHVPRTMMANSCAMVDQDLFFFEGTARENLSLWDATLPDDAVQQAAKDACIHTELASRRGAYATHIEEGGRNFSGGQRQRLEIARALAVDPTILILDEATSSLDAATEKIVDDNIRRRGCTCVIVAHRLSTIRDCNEIIVLERGEVVQRGRHEDLIKVDGPYARLIRTE